MKDWYREAHGYCVQLSEQYGVSLDKVVSVVALLSPQTRWEVNKEQAEQFLSGREVTGIVTAKCLDKCREIMRGRKFPDVIHARSMKIRSFYYNILYPECCLYVTVDTHIFNAYKIAHPCSKMTTAKRMFTSKKQYNTIANWVRREARKRGMIPCEYQAILWTKQRES